jgi:hypothetical protein
MACEPNLEPAVGRTGIDDDRPMGRIGQKNRSLDWLTSHYTMSCKSYVDGDRNGIGPTRPRGTANCRKENQASRRNASEHKEIMTPESGIVASG